MPRGPRIEFPDAIYHVMARGNRQERIVHNDGDRVCFVETLGETCHRTGWEVFAWVLMDNHYHLAVRTPEANLVAGMSWFQNAFTRRINTRNQLWGHLFGGRYKSILVEDEKHGDSGRWHEYLVTLMDYIHLNPARAGLVDGSDRSVLDYRWSSVAEGYGKAPSKRPGWMNVTEGLDLFGEPDTVAGRRRFVERLDVWAATEASETVGFSQEDGQSLHSTLRRGWYWGSERFKETLLERYGEGIAGRGKRKARRNAATGDHAVAAAEEIIREGSRHYGGRESEWLASIRGDLRKSSIAWAVWKTTSVSQGWMADRLEMKSASNVSQSVRRFDNLSRREMPKSVWEWKKKMLKFFT